MKPFLSCLAIIFNIPFRHRTFNLPNWQNGPESFAVTERIWHGLCHVIIGNYLHQINTKLTIKMQGFETEDES